MIIKILSSGCSKCQALTENTRKALADTGREAEILKVTDFAGIAAHGVMSTPALVVDGKVVSAGKVLTPAEIRAYL